MTDEFIDVEENYIGDELAYSRRLDVHRWSDHTEVNEFVDQIFNDNFINGNQRIRRKHVKVVLLDLYIAWITDPNLKISYSRNVNDYKAGSIYNELHISRTTIDVVDRLIELELINQKLGFIDHNSGVSRLSRIWPTDDLVEIFRNVHFHQFDILYSPDRLAIELRDDDKKPIQYEITPEITEFNNTVSEYNNLMRVTFVSVPSLDSARVEWQPEFSDQPSYEHINQSSKFTKRIFNNSSFDLGGRFYGGFWQNCPKSIRNEILINDQLTCELDYSSLHPTILYAMNGIDYWREIATDPYLVNSVSFQNDPTELRGISKLLMLILINMDSREHIPAAFRSRFRTGSYKKSLTNNEVFEVLDQLIEKHELISEYFHSGIGLELQNIDSRISEKIIQYFVAIDEPVLLIHDSYIVRLGWEDDLKLAMQKSFAEVMGQDFATSVDYVNLPYEDIENELRARDDFRYGQRGSEEEEAYEHELYLQIAPKRSVRYLKEYNLFKEWLINIQQ